MCDVQLSSALPRVTLPASAIFGKSDGVYRRFPVVSVKSGYGPSPRRRPALAMTENCGIVGLQNSWRYRVHSSPFIWQFRRSKRENAILRCI